MLNDPGLWPGFLMAAFINAGYSFLILAESKGWFEVTEEEMEQDRQRVKELKESGEWERISQERQNFIKRILYGVLVFMLSIICYVIYWSFDDSY